MSTTPVASLLVLQHLTGGIASIRTDYADFLSFNVESANESNAVEWGNEEGRASGYKERICCNFDIDRQCTSILLVSVMVKLFM